MILTPIPFAWKRIMDGTTQAGATAPHTNLEIQIYK